MVRHFLAAIMTICVSAQAATWDESIVYYSIDRHAPKFAKETIRSAAGTWTALGVVTLVETQKGNEHLAKIVVKWESKRNFKWPVNPFGFAAYGTTRWTLKDDGHLNSAVIHINARDYRYPHPVLSLFSLACHELGHAIGLWPDSDHHSEDDGDLMYHAQIQGQEGTTRLRCGGFTANEKSIL